MDPVVVVEQGQLRGKIQQDRKDQPFYSFLGIPYAKPPIGDLRFKAPHSPEPWKGVRDATQPGPISYALQDEDGENAYIRVREKGSEDSLNLNVYTRELPKDRTVLKPVMFWVHGGGFINGSSHPDIYGPEHLICEDVVLVSINYRLGIFGFLCLENSSLGVTGNAGLKDQVMALRWVQKNIKQFNGDPNNVTIFGESAGGASVNYLMLSPLAKGLIHKTIIMSGSSLNCWARTDGNMKLVADALGMDPKQEKQILKKLQSMSTADVFAIQKKIGDAIQLDKYRPFVPMIESPSAHQPLITEDPFQMMRSGQYNHMPVMIGYDSGESYDFQAFRDIGLFDIHFGESDEDLVPLNIHVEKGSNRYNEIVRKMKKFYFGGDEMIRHCKGFYDFGSDAIIIRGVNTTARTLVKNLGHPLYYYRFSLETELNEFKKLSGVKFPGATHGDELNYLFHHKQTATVTKGSAEDIGIERMVKIWANFAKTGNPLNPSDPVLRGAVWQPVTTDKLHFVDIGQELVPGVGPEPERMAFWDEVYSLNPEHLRY